MNQKELTAKLNEINPDLNLKQPYLSRYINNKTNQIPNDFLITLSKLSNYSIDWILTGEGPAKKTKINQIEKDFDKLDIKIINLLKKTPELKNTVYKYLKGAVSGKEALQEFKEFYNDHYKS